MRSFGAVLMLVLLFNHSVSRHPINRHPPVPEPILSCPDPRVDHTPVHQNSPTCEPCLNVTAFAGTPAATPPTPPVSHTSRDDSLRAILNVENSQLETILDAPTPPLSLGLLGTPSGQTSEAPHGILAAAVCDSITHGSTDVTVSTVETLSLAMDRSSVIPDTSRHVGPGASLFANATMAPHLPPVVERASWSSCLTSMELIGSPTPPPGSVAPMALRTTATKIMKGTSRRSFRIRK